MSISLVLNEKNDGIIVINNKSNDLNVHRVLVWWEERMLD